MIDDYDVNVDELVAEIMGNEGEERLDTPCPEKKRPGRPKKQGEERLDTPCPEKKRPGRPRKQDSEQTEAVESTGHAVSGKREMSIDALLSILEQSRNVCDTCEIRIAEGQERTLGGAVAEIVWAEDSTVCGMVVTLV